jgi:hypothetical protein
MDISAFLLLAVLVVVIAFFIARPLLNKEKEKRLENSGLSSLLAERDRVLDSLADLDLDHSLGKIPEEEYPTRRSELVQRGAAVLRKIDEFQVATAGEPGKDKKPSVLTDEQIEDLVSKRRSAQMDHAAGFCPQCGRPVLKSDQFCPQCGKPLV